MKERRKTQLLDEVRNMKYWELKEEAEERKMGKRQFIT